MSLPIPIGRAGGGLGGLGLVGPLIYLAIQWLGGGAGGLNVGSRVIALSKGTRRERRARPPLR
jgi:hypothetical protein